MSKLIGPILILLCTLIWGTAFLAQKTGSAHYAPFTLTCFRNLLAGVFLLAVVLIRNLATSRRLVLTRKETIGGFLSGAILFFAMATQQLGIEHTTPGVSAFLTANYILIVPILVWAIGRGRPRMNVWAGVALALAGTYLICFTDASVGFSLGVGERWTLLCALLFATQIIVVACFAPGSDVLVFSLVQMFAAALVAVPLMALPSEAARFSLSEFRAGWRSLVYLGVFSSGIAYTLQNLGQARTPVALAAIVMSFESVVGAVGGYLYFHDILTTAQIVGCVLVFFAILLSQVFDR